MHDTADFVLTIEAVAERLQVCDKTVRNRLKKRGNLAPDIARKIGRRWRFSEAVFSSPLALPG